MAFTHARNLMYTRAGHDVEVLSFSSREPYNWDGIDVCPESYLTKQRLKLYDVVVFHSPNLRNHLRFILMHRRSIRAEVLIAHGFEFINWCHQVGRPFNFQLTWALRIKFAFRSIYDQIKIRVWAFYFKMRRSQLNLVFVSHWLRHNAENCLGLNLERFTAVTEINNPVHPLFIENSYQADGEKDADFVTIRSFDEPKYAMDVVLEFAKKHPQWTFHVFGHGHYFEHFLPPPNLKVIQQRFKQSQLPDLLNRYRAALLPTHWDSQGVLMCEMACFGIPLVVSDLPICRTMVGEFSNVVFIDNRDPVLNELPDQVLNSELAKRKFAFEQTVGKELRLFEDLIQNDSSDPCMQ